MCDADLEDNFYTTMAPKPNWRVDSADELWALIKFRLVSMGSVDEIEAEIDRMVAAWREHIAQDEESVEMFRRRLFGLAREGIEEDHVAAARRKQ